MVELFDVGLVEVESPQALPNNSAGYERTTELRYFDSRVDDLTYLYCGGASVEATEGVTAMFSCSAVSPVS